MSRFSEFLRAHQRWLVLVLLFGISLVNSLDRQSLSVLAPTLEKQLHFGPEQYSYVVSSFLAAYTLGYVFAGRILDRLGVKLGLALALGFWSIMALLHATAASWMMLALLRFLLGLGESFNSPAGVKAVAEWIPPRERGISMAVISNGNVWGQILAAPLVSFLALYLGWRWAFLGSAAMGLAMLVVWWVRYDSPTRSNPRLTEKEHDYIAAALGPVESASSKLSVWALLANPLCLGFFAIRFLTDSWSYFLSFWLPEYLVHARGFTLATIGAIGWLPYLAADVGGPLGGAASDWLVRRGWAPDRARRTLMLTAACLMPLSLLAVRVDAVWIAVGLIGLLYAAQTCWMANQLTLISESVSRQNVATLLSLSALGGGLGGIVSNLCVGKAVASVGYVPVFTGFGLLHLTAFGVLTLTRLWSRRQSEGGARCPQRAG